LKHLAISNGGGLAVWCTDETLRIRMYLPATRRWVEVSGRLGCVSVSADGFHIWGINPITSEVFYRNGVESCWVTVSGSLRQVRVSGNGRHVWGLNYLHEIYYRAGLEGSWIRFQVPSMTSAFP
jgi:hypothetical protein